MQNIEKINSCSFLQVTSMQNFELTMPSHVLEREEVEDELSQKRACEKSLNQYKVPKPESEIGEVLVSKTFPRDTEKQDRMQIENAKTVLNQDLQKEKKRKRKRCESCVGCKAEECGKCTPCTNNAIGIGPKQLCRDRKCLALKKKNRCGICSGCTSTACGYCGQCRANFSQLCLARKCQNPSMKQNSNTKKTKKCNQCAGCQAGPCGTCGHCTKNYPNLCPFRKCQNLALVDKMYDMSSKEKDHPKKTKMKIKTKRCMECPGCKASPCGECGTCQKNYPNLCRSTRCQKLTAQVVDTERSTILQKKTGKSKSTKRQKMCRECDECLTSKDCGTCTSCKVGGMTSLGKVDCLNIRCTNLVDVHKEMLQDGGPCDICLGCLAENCGTCLPCRSNSKDKVCIQRTCQRKQIPTSRTTMIQLMAEQDDTADGTCPIKIINGIVYDFRCYFCKKLPRPCLLYTSPSPRDS